MVLGVRYRHDSLDCLAEVVVAALGIHPSRQHDAVDRVRGLLETVAKDFEEPLPALCLVNVFAFDEVAQATYTSALAIANETSDGSLAVSMWREDEGTHVAVVGDSQPREVRLKLARIFSIGTRRGVSAQRILDIYHSRPAALAAKAVSDEHGEPLREAMGA